MFQSCKNLCLNNLKPQLKFYARSISAEIKADIKKKQNQIFDDELQKQKSAVGRIEKIEVKYQSPVEEVILSMNKNLSTPYDCAKHISEGVAKVSALALVDGTITWDMHRPLESNCELKLLNLTSPAHSSVNYAYWRTCSLILGAVIESAFKDNIELQLHSFPIPNLQSGSFTYDVVLDLPDWKPTDMEMRALSALFIKFVEKGLPVERLETTENIALEIFEKNPFKSEQIPEIARSNEGTLVLYRIGDHIDISKGPMVGNTNIMGRTTVTAVHKIKSEDLDGRYRFQGVSIPKGIMMNHFAYGILEERAKKLNESTWIPQKVEDNLEEDLTLHAKN